MLNDDRELYAYGVNLTSLQIADPYKELFMQHTTDFWLILVLIAIFLTMIKCLSTSSH